MLQQIVYMSALSDHVEESCLRDILAEASARNPEHHVTGMLLYVNGSFLQVIEGDSSTLESLYKKISGDPRHARPVKIAQMPIEDREFAQWSMGWAQVDAAELDQRLGQNDFFSSGRCITELEDTQIRQILEGFKSGHWRRQIE